MGWVIRGERGPELVNLRRGTLVRTRHTPYCPLSKPVLERGTPPNYDPDELPIQCTCDAEGRDH